VRIITHGRFRRRTENLNGTSAVFAVAHCSKCPATSDVRLGQGSSLEPEGVAKKLRARGWTIAGTAAGDLCPRCAGRNTPLSKSQKRAAYCRIAGVPRAKPEETKVSAAEKPKAPTINDRRRIMDALEAHYDTDAGRYSKAFTDDALAATLDVPRAWVAEIRLAFFGEGAGNEAATLRDAAIAEVEAGMKALSDDFLGRLDALERQVRALKLDRSYAVKG
jgi:hypothetical protein